MRMVYGERKIKYVPYETGALGVVDNVRWKTLSVSGEDGRTED